MKHEIPKFTQWKHESSEHEWGNIEAYSVGADGITVAFIPHSDPKSQWTVNIHENMKELALAAVQDDLCVWAKFHPHPHRKVNENDPSTITQLIIYRERKENKPIP